MSNETIMSAFDAAVEEAKGSPDDAPFDMTVQDARALRSHVRRGESLIHALLDTPENHPGRPALEEMAWSYLGGEDEDPDDDDVRGGWLFEPRGEEDPLVHFHRTVAVMIKAGEEITGLDLARATADERRFLLAMRDASATYRRSQATKT